MEFDVTVTFVSRYNFTNDQTGEILKGCKVTFMLNEESDDDDSFGRRTQTGVMEYEKFEDLKTQKLPLKAKACYEFKSLDKKPKFIGLKY